MDSLSLSLYKKVTSGTIEWFVRFIRKYIEYIVRKRVDTRLFHQMLALKNLRKEINLLELK